jgi:hypothetical protein
LDEIQTKVFRVSFLAIHSHRYSFALRFLFLQTHATSYSFYGSITVHYTVKEKGGKPDKKPYPLLAKKKFYGLYVLYVLHKKLTHYDQNVFFLVA